jgi:hypothetical protein
MLDTDWPRSERMERVQLRVSQRMSGRRFSAGVERGVRGLSSDANSSSESIFPPAPQISERPSGVKSTWFAVESSSRTRATDNFPARSRWIVTMS